MTITSEAPATAVAAPPTSRSRRPVLITVLDAIMPIATIGLMVYFGVASAAFFTLDNFIVVLQQSAPLMIAAVMAAVLLMSGNIDLSVGSIMAVSGVCAGLAFPAFGLVPGLLIGLLAGVLLGAVNGALIGFFELSPIVITLGMLAAGRGLALTLAPGSLFGFPEGVAKLGSGSFLGIPYLVWIAAAVVLLGMLLMNRFAAGKHVIAIGVNRRAAFLNGIPVKRMIFSLYTLMGLAAGLAGVLTVARLNSAPSGTLGLGFEVAMLTAVLLGSVPFTGGRGAIWRVVLGVWLMGILKNGVTLLNIGPEVGDILTGLVLIVAAALEGIRYFYNRRRA